MESSGKEGAQKRPRSIDDIRDDLLDAMSELNSLVAFEHPDYVRFRNLQYRTTETRMRVAVTQLETECSFHDSLYNALAESADAELKADTIALRDALVNHLSDAVIASAAAVDARRTRAMGHISVTRNKTAGRPPAVPGAPPPLPPAAASWPDPATLKVHNMPRVERLAPPNFAWRAAPHDVSADLTSLAAVRATPVVRGRKERRVT